MSDGYAMLSKEIRQYLTIIKLYEQQQYMYDNKVHSVEHRIISISQPWLRPIVRGKVKAPVEFGVDINNGDYKCLLNQQTLIIVKMNCQYKIIVQY